MSKKQAILNSFFQPKTKDYALSSTPLRIKSRNFLKCGSNSNSNNNFNKSSGNIVISLLSSDEEDEGTSGNEKRIVEQDNSTVISPKNELKFKNEEIADTSITDEPDECCATVDFVDVIVEEESVSLDTKKNPQLLDEFTDYKWSSFSSMIDWVLNDKSNYHLFDEDDWKVIEGFKSMSGKRRLLVKSICQISRSCFVFSSVPTTVRQTLCEKTSMD